MFLALNQPYLTTNLLGSPHASPFDGTMDLIYTQNPTLNLIPGFLNQQSGNYVYSTGFHVLQGIKEFILESLDINFGGVFDIDGEYLGRGLLHVKILPNHLQFITPHESNLSSVMIPMDYGLKTQMRSWETYKKERVWWRISYFILIILLIKMFMTLI